MSSVDSIAAAINQDLNTQFDGDFTSTVNYVLDDAFENVTELKARVLPRDEITEVHDRKSNIVTYTVDIAVIQPAPVGELFTPENIAERLEKPRQIRSYLDRKQQDGVSWKSSTLTTTFSYDMLKKTRVLLTMIHNEYRERT